MEGMPTSNIKSCTYGAVRDLYAACDTGRKVLPYVPRLRVVYAKRLGQPPGSGRCDRWRVHLSDGATVMLGMAAPEVTELLDNGDLTVGQLIDVESYNVTLLGVGTRVCILVRVATVPGGDIEVGMNGLQWEGGVPPNVALTAAKSNGDKRIVPSSDVSDSCTRGNCVGQGAGKRVRVAL